MHRRSFSRRSVITGLLAVGCAAVPTVGTLAGPASAASPSRDVIVMLTDSSPSPDSVAAEHAQKRRAQVREVYSAALRGYAASVPADQVAALQADPRVEAVVENKHTSFGAPNVANKKAGGFPQLLPFATDRVDADVSSTRAGDQRGKVDVDVAVIDTGVGPHNDLNVVGGVNCGDAGSTKKDWTDEVLGHGTSVAGIIGAADNSRDWVGVAPGARIWSVRVDNQNQDTELANVLCGIEWVIKRSNVIDVVNMSIAFEGSDDGNCGRTNHDPMHRAICRLVRAGVPVAAAAGNETTDTAARTPAAYDEVMAVSAMADFDGIPGGLDKSGAEELYGPWCPGIHDDTVAFFSNFGPDVDLIAPGVCVETLFPFGFDSDGNTFPDPDAWQLVSGTSFSSPHVAGAAALYKSKHPKASPAKVRAALVQAGTYDYDNSLDPDGIKEPLLNVASF